MKTLIVETKETVWHRSEYEVEDDITPENLVKMIKQNEIDPSYTEGYLYDTAEQMLPLENGSYSTIEIKEDNRSSEVIWKNGI